MFLKVLQDKSETYIVFSIKNLLIKEGDFIVLKSLIQIMIPISVDPTPKLKVKPTIEKYIQIKNNEMMKKISTKNSEVI